MTTLGEIPLGFPFVQDQAREGTGLLKWTACRMLGEGFLPVEQIT